MAFVLDASICAAWALADESATQAEIAEDRLKRDIGLVPRIWWYEVRNLLIVSERRQRIAADESAAFLRVLSAYPIRVDTLEDEAAIFHLARKHRLSFYDAAYLALAQANRTPLATLDKALEAAALAEGVPLLS
ncbi:MAG: type II toxin-antitoxin system VapC family toxin [Terracidiphilus sp.]